MIDPREIYLRGSFLCTSSEGMRTDNIRMVNLYKRYCDVELKQTKEGKLIPLAIYWIVNGTQRRYEIDKILEGPVRRASPVGGCGMRWIVKVCGQERTLFEERDVHANSTRFFVESRRP